MAKKQPIPLTGRDKMLHDLAGLHSSMRQIVLAAGVQERHFDSVLSGIEGKTNEEIEGLYEWLQYFNDVAIRGVLDIWGLKSEEWWFNMAMIFRQTKTREHKLLKTARKQLRRVWYKRHGQPIDEVETTQQDANLSDTA